MAKLFEEVAYRETSIGALSLRRRRMRSDGPDIWEIRLDEGYLMSSQFVAGEEALATLSLSDLSGHALDVVVGGLGLGYTANAVLDHEEVASLLVVELIPEVIEWHRERHLPLSARLVGDPRCRLIAGDFFALACNKSGFDPSDATRRHDAILVDIDHSPRHLLVAGNASFYEPEGLHAIAESLNPRGVFGLWSTDAVDEIFLSNLQNVFSSARAERVEFFNPYQSAPAFNIIYIARRD